MFNMFSGGALERASILALGIMPYISASIVVQLLTVVHPALAELKKEGEAGRRKISNIRATARLYLQHSKRLVLQQAYQTWSTIWSLSTKPCLP